MEIGIDITPLTAPRTGVGVYCQQLVRGLAASGASLRGYAISHRPVDEDALAEGVPYSRTHVPTRAMYGVWRAVPFPTAESLIGHPVDVVHGVNYMLPPLRRATGVVTIHDLTFMRYPELCSPKITRLFAKRVPESCARAAVVIADSVATKGDAMGYFGIPEEKIAVVHLAPSPERAPMARDDAQRILADAYGIDGPFMLHVGTIEPRKNLDGLLYAFEQIQSSIPHRLVLVGGEGWHMATFEHALAETKLGDRVVRPGFVPDADLNAFYSAADAFVFPTHYEGFGLPVLDAMACGCPVVATATASVPEVAGDAAVLVSPDDIEGLGMALAEVLNDSARRDALGAAGMAQAARFDWAATAAETFAAYERAAACA